MPFNGSPNTLSLDIGGGMRNGPHGAYGIDHGSCTVRQLTAHSALQACSARGMRARWCHCACCQGRGGWSRRATAAAPAMCGPAPAGPACAASPSRATPLSRPPTAARPGAGNTLAASSPLTCTSLPRRPWHAVRVERLIPATLAVRAVPTGWNY